MKSKIGKLEDNVLGDGITAGIIVPDNRQLQEKINEIIDYLNSQDQEEEKTLEQLRGEFDKERIKEWDRTAIETYKQATQDTPEKELTDKKKDVDKGVDREDTPEEWEEKARVFDEIHDILKPYHKEAEYYPDTLKRILGDREREVYVDGYKDGITRCMESLDKLLNSKKK